MKKKELTPELFTLLAGGLAPGRLRVEVTAGIVVGIVALPLAVAFAIASGVGPEQGIITAVLAGFVISFLGGSRVQIGGPTGAFVVIVYSIIQRYGLDGLMLSTIMAGFFLIVMGVLRLGSLIEYVPQTLITGFTSGIAVLIFSTQVKDLLGLSVDNLPTEFVPKWIEYFRAVAVDQSVCPRHRARRNPHRPIDSAVFSTSPRCVRRDRREHGGCCALRSPG
jgi:SulP family sulfate permease